MLHMSPHNSVPPQVAAASRQVPAASQVPLLHHHKSPTEHTLKNRMNVHQLSARTPDISTVLTFELPTTDLFLKSSGLIPSSASRGHVDPDRLANCRLVRSRNEDADDLRWRFNALSIKSQINSE